VLVDDVLLLDVVVEELLDVVEVVVIQVPGQVSERTSIWSKIKVGAPTSVFIDSTIPT